jgi:hypothetical protein
MKSPGSKHAYSVYQIDAFTPERKLKNWNGGTDILRLTGPFGLLPSPGTGAAAPSRRGV